MVSEGRLLERRVSRRPPSRCRGERILVVCEGKVTEPAYLRSYTHACKNRLVEVHPYPGAGVPLTVVATAIRLRDESEDLARQQRDGSLRYNQVWAVFDVDEHPGVEEARRNAANAGVRVAVSNPSFELWALLHFQDQEAFIERWAAASALRNHMPGYEKCLKFELMRGGHTGARDRACRLDMLDAQHGGRRRNPTTDVFRLLDEIGVVE